MLNVAWISPEPTFVDSRCKQGKPCHYPTNILWSSKHCHYPIVSYHTIPDYIITHQKYHVLHHIVGWCVGFSKITTYYITLLSSNLFDCYNLLQISIRRARIFEYIYIKNKYSNIFISKKWYERISEYIHIKNDTNLI